MGAQAIRAPGPTMHPQHIHEHAIKPPLASNHIPDLVIAESTTASGLTRPFALEGPGPYLPTTFEMARRRGAATSVLSEPSASLTVSRASLYATCSTRICRLPVEALSDGESECAGVGVLSSFRSGCDVGKWCVLGAVTPGGCWYGPSPKAGAQEPVLRQQLQGSRQRCGMAVVQVHLRPSYST